MNYIIENKININTIATFALIIFVTTLLLPNFAYADNLYGQSCGNTKCSQNEVCQKQYRGVLPIGGQNSGNATYTCVKPEAIEAPDSPYKGEQTPACGEVFKKAFGLDLSKFTGNDLIKTIESGLKTIRGGLGSALRLDISGPVNLDLNGELNWSIDPTNLIGTDLSYFKDFVPKCNSEYNNIKGIINTNYLVAPLPVDIFNPLPLPVNVTSPTPLPVVVVDDLALYQQKELIDAPLAAQQKAKTIATVSDTLRYQISNDNLIPNNYYALKQLGVQFGALDSQTGVISKEAIDTYGNYANFSLDKNNQLAKYFRGIQNQESQLIKESFSEKCGNIKVEESSTFECMIEGLKTNNNGNDIATMTAYLAARKSEEATNLLDQEVRDGSGYFAKADSQNPFTKTIQTPGSNIASLSEKVTEATVDQAVIAAGDNCFEAIPKNILDGTLKPVLTQGLYGVNNTLSSVINNATTNPVNTLQNPQDFAIQLRDSTTNQFNPDRFFRSLQDSLVSNLTSSLSCELNKQISGLLNGIIGNVTLPGIGNVNSLITNTVSNGVNNLVQD